MTEKLLQYIWQFQFYDARNLCTVQGEPLSIIQSGLHNTNQGPDFLNARITVNGTTWAGNIEMHVLASDWQLHGHDTDGNYQNIILHVVWKNDAGPKADFPVLELQPYVSSVLLARYEELMQSSRFIPCQAHIGAVPSLSLQAWKERLMVERLQQKMEHISGLLQTNNNHWEETFWWMLARNFGSKINADSFERIARSIPLNILAKHKSQLLQIESILFGQAAMLDKQFDESYPNMLRKEYQFLQQKYHLEKAHAPLFFLRMRPANFPGIRLAQLAMLVHQSSHLFSRIREAKTVAELEQMFDITANDYWHYHYRFDEETHFLKKNLGRQMIRSIIINTIVPFVYAYGRINASEAFMDKALAWMEALPPEENAITKGFVQLGLTHQNAFDSQALIQLKNVYCNYKQCLHCGIGAQVLKARAV